MSVNSCGLRIFHFCDLYSYVSCVIRASVLIIVRIRNSFIVGPYLIRDSYMFQWRTNRENLQKLTMFDKQFEKEYDVFNTTNE